MTLPTRSRSIAILDNQWANICARRWGLPAVAGRNASRRGSPHHVLPGDQVAARASVVNSCVRPMIDQTPGVNGEQWPRGSAELLAAQRHSLAEGANAAAYHHAFGWHQHFVAYLGRATTRALATQGLPYATGLVKRVARLLDDVLMPACRPVEVRSRRHRRPARRDEGDAGVTRAPSPTQGRSPTRCSPVRRAPSAAESMRHWPTMSPIRAGAMVTEVFDPLIDALNEAQTMLRQAAGANRQQVGLAQLQTDEYAAWPADADELVADRFSEADNEVMLTRSADFKQRYEIDRLAAVGATSSDPACWAGIRGPPGMWSPATGPPWTAAKSPAELQPVVERTTTWISRAFLRHPETGDGLIAQRATYDVHLRPAELLSRARRFVARTGESFDRFCSVSLREYVEADAPGVRASRAVPTWSCASSRRSTWLVRWRVSTRTPCQAIHGVAEMVYRYKFSGHPFWGCPSPTTCGPAWVRRPVWTRRVPTPSSTP